ncbi:VWA domain-containing protein [Winogradskyella sp. DF17]|uniref:VWA domain-containing protein n=1 Tax=Winogradskyella pelagia TaxID=2819984 RepID=A0ABS3T3X6_9FLAO|nr:VWA domain-containing protein [Winogradskyella sp. DF17]MBO3117450.1 VWA domain-containing protein [Winogradskyella sp. DF17]
MDDLSTSEYMSYAWDNLWFMRPDWLYAFIPIGILIVLFLLTFNTRASWKKNFSADLLPFLIIKGTKRQFIIPKIILILFLSLITIAASGPTWEQIENPGQKTEAVLLVLLDLSRSMLAEDIQPNRIERAKLKLEDFFKAKPKAKVGLVAYAGSVHSVVPFSKDYKTINRQMEALRPDIMPIQGSNLSEALDLADSLLAKIIAPSTIIIVTDNVEEMDIPRLAQTAVQSHIEVMAISTPGGATIPVGKRDLKDKAGNTVISSLNTITLNQIEAIENANVITVTLDDSDVKILAARVRQNLEFEIDLENAEEEWKDFGYWLCFPLLLLTLFSFRRGWKVHWVWLLLLAYNCNEEQNLNIDELFFTKDQQGQRFLKKGDTLRALETFKSGNIKGYTYYNMGNFEKAAEAYSEDVSDNGFYNLGVVLYKIGDYEGAQQAFNSALEINPQLSPAKLNLEKVVRVIDSIQKENGLILENATESPYDPDKFQEYTESPDEKDTAQKSDKKYDGKGDIQEMVTKEVDENTIDVFEFDENAVIDKDAAKQTLLRQVKEDPAIFLRRKFAYQIKNRKIKPKKQDKDW